MNLLRKLREEHGILIIAATHDIFTALFYFDEIIMIKNGSVFANGSSETVINRENLSSLYGIDVTVRREGGKVFIYPGD
jgi:iron complex transport system ATP-binding protein